MESRHDCGDPVYVQSLVVKVQKEVVPERRLAFEGLVLMLYIVSDTNENQLGIPEYYLLILRWFCFDPKRPCNIIKGLSFGVFEGGNGSCEVYARLR